MSPHREGHVGYCTTTQSQNRGILRSHAGCHPELTWSSLRADSGPVTPVSPIDSAPHRVPATLSRSVTRWSAVLRGARAQVGAATPGGHSSPLSCVARRVSSGGDPRQKVAVWGRRRHSAAPTPRASSARQPADRTTNARPCAHSSVFLIASMMLSSSSSVWHLPWPAIVSFECTSLPATSTSKAPDLPPGYTRAMISILRPNSSWRNARSAVAYFS